MKTPKPSKQIPQNTLPSQPKERSVSTLSDREIIDFVESVGNCFIEGDYVVSPEVAEETVKVAKHFMGQKSKRGIGLIGTNGVGKSLLFKIMKAIAPYFGESFSWVDAENLTIEGAERIYKKKVFLDELGKDSVRNNYGNKEDAVYRLLDLKNKMYENGLSADLYFSSNLSIEGYQTIAERYDKRFFDRIRTICELVVFGDVDGESSRGKTSPKEPDKTLINNVITSFMRDVLCIDYSKQIHPLIDKNIQILLESLRNFVLEIRKEEKAMNYVAYLSLCNSYRFRTNELRSNIEASEAAKLKYWETYERVESYFSQKKENEPVFWKDHYLRNGGDNETYKDKLKAFHKKKGGLQVVDYQGERKRNFEEQKRLADSVHSKLERQKTA